VTNAMRSVFGFLICLPLAVRAQQAVEQRGLLNKYCVTCHSEKLKTGGLSLEKPDVANVVRDSPIWEKVILKLRSGMMPPPNLPRPDKSSADTLVRYLESSLDRAAAQAPNPGRPATFHRLNRIEYQNSVRDLLGLEIDAGELLPPDDAGFGFDNMAGLRMSPALMERYIVAARKISRLAVGGVNVAPAEEEIRVPSNLRQDEHLDGLPFGTRGGTKFTFMFPLDAEYTIRVKTTGGRFPDRHELEISLDGERVGYFPLLPPPPRQAKGSAQAKGQPTAASPKPSDPDADADSDKGKGYQARILVKAGPHEIIAAFLQRTEAWTETNRKTQLRPSYHAGGLQWEPYVGSVVIGGPFKPTGPGDTPSRRRIFCCAPGCSLTEGACARQILSQLLRRAYRRPATPEDLQLLMRFYDEGRTNGSFESGIESAVRMILVSPSFLTRVERDPAGAAVGSNYRITDLELASRLSFFLWSSIPDDTLLDLAIAGKLSDRSVLEQQVKRMLADNRSDALVKNLTGQWLYMRNLAAVLPDEELFPNFDDNLRRAMQTETEMFFGSIVKEDRSVIDLLDANYTFLNERLARHYGIPGVAGSHFRRVSLEGTPRAGLLGQASILTVTSNAVRTSPVLRGKWILENLLGTPPPEPPPSVPALKENTDGAKPLSVRERLEEHRKSPACASCHRIMDPLGFALENFDAVGAFRSVGEGGSRIDASGQLVDGTAIEGAAGLRNALVNHHDDFVRTFAGKLLTYAIGRGLEGYDAPHVRKIAREAAQADYKFSSLVLGVVESVPFQMRRTAQ